MPSLSELIYFNLHSDDFQIQISSPDFCLELAPCMHGLPSILTWLSQCILWTWHAHHRTHRSPHQVCSSCGLSVSVTQWVIKPKFSASPANQCPGYYSPHSLQVFTAIVPLGHTPHLSPPHHSRFFQTAACAHLYMSSFLNAQLGIKSLSIYSLCTYTNIPSDYFSDAVEIIYCGPVFSVLSHKRFKVRNCDLPISVPPVSSQCLTRRRLWTNVCCTLHEEPQARKITDFHTPSHRFHLSKKKSRHKTNLSNSASLLLIIPTYVLSTLQFQKYLHTHYLTITVT